MRWIYRKIKQVATSRREFIFEGNENMIFLPDKSFSCQDIKLLLKVNQYKGENITRKLIEYFHTPVDCHPENMASGDLYADLMKMVYPLLAIKKMECDQILTDIINGGDIYLFHDKQSGFAIIRNEIIPIIIQFFHIRIFGRPCDNKILQILSNNVIQFKKTISFISFPNERIRKQVLHYIYSQCSDEVVSNIVKTNPSEVNKEQLSKLIMGVFFHTGVIQVSEFVAHTIVALSQNPTIQDSLRINIENDDYVKRILQESLRLYPLFGITNRIAEKDCCLNKDKIIPRGTNIIFSFVHCHSLGFKNPSKFDPDRWLNYNDKTTCYMPFGNGSRMCPAQNVAYNLATPLVRTMIRQHHFFSSIEHDRALTGGGLVYFSKKNKSFSTPIMLFFISVREAITQLFYNVKVILNCNYMLHGDFLNSLLNGELKQKDI
ncbi:cytochrome P450 [Enterobacter hormaechei]|uniref:cytochrome P450 n=1 Tax=Enterobacter hormaechei TaxID=158836 RepID=UPI000751559A|nr:cytochrome P450 [Enterobacter hormaechei]KUR02955.1 hypothetical protein AWI31_08245 [Enterobacter hormaechei subsp. xiangfangensis]